MRALLKAVVFDPEPSRLPADPAEFAFGARLVVGPEDDAGEESFDVTVCLKRPRFSAAAMRVGTAR